MRILITNDDGINSDGLWVLARELLEIAQVTIVVPDSERSAIGTAVNLFRPLMVEKVKPKVSGVRAYTTDGTPADCVILAMGKLTDEKTDLVISGINDGNNLGEDVYISGTVGGALQGYFRGSSALAISAPHESKAGRETAARVASSLAARIYAINPPAGIFLNVNTPNLPAKEVSGIQLSRLACTSHINSVAEDDDLDEHHFRLVRQQISGSDIKGTDMYAVKHGWVSITPLFTSLFRRPPQRLLQELCTGIL
jgi:5'-nucleotidase